MDATAVPSPERVLIVSASVGAGHDGAARELQHRLVRQGVVTQTRDFLDALPRWLRFTVREGYARTVNHTPWFYDWLYAAMEHRGPVQWIGLLVCALGRRTVLRWAGELQADAVVSTYPLASQALGQLVARGRLRVPTTTFLTDPSVHALWVNRHVHRHLTVLSTTATIGRTRYRTAMTATGPLVPDRFAAPLDPDRRAAVRAALGAGPDRPLALVVTGSLGLGDVVATVAAVEDTGVATPLVLCGRNEALRNSLAARPGVLAFGWRDDVHELMQACDVLVHNAGGLSFSESLVAGLPAVTYACIPGHGRANGVALAQGGVAPLADTVVQLRNALRRQLRPGAREAVLAAVSGADDDASSLVLRDLRTRGRSVLRAGHDVRRRRQRVRRRVSALAATALVAGSSLAATEGVSAATRHGYGVARMPVGTVALVVAAPTLRGASHDLARLRSAHAAVLAPSRPTSADLVAARALTAAGVPVLARACAPSTLLHHTERSQVCGAGRRLAAAGVPVSSSVLAPPEVEALDLLVARRDRTHLVLAQRTPQQSVGRGAGQVWVVGRGTHGAADLSHALTRARSQTAASGLRNAPVSDARARL